MYNNYVEFTIGCDPELFLWDDEVFYASQPYVKGTKDEPHKLECGGIMMRDNVAVEFGTVPAKTEDEFISNLDSTIRELWRTVSRVSKKYIIPWPSAHFNKSQLTHAECKEFGCEPDFNAWRGGEMNEMPESAADGTFRTCGGHLHIGTLGQDTLEFLEENYGKRQVIRGMDLTCGLVSVILDNTKAAIKRRELYGKPGCYRPTNYGVEYRTLSNFWIRLPEYARLMYRLTDLTLKFAVDYTLDDKIEEAGGQRTIERCIETGDVDVSKDIISDVLVKELDDDTLHLLNFCADIPMSAYSSPFHTVQMFASGWAL